MTVALVFSFFMQYFREKLLTQYLVAGLYTIRDLKCLYFTSILLVQVDSDWNCKKKKKNPGHFLPLLKSLRLITEPILDFIFVIYWTTLTLSYPDENSVEVYPLHVW